MSIAARNAILAGGAALPYDAEVEYLESTGTQWIDTGVKLQTPCVVETKLIPVGSNFNDRMMLGVFSGGNTRLAPVAAYRNNLVSKSADGKNTGIVACQGGVEYSVKASFSSAGFLWIINNVSGSQPGASVTSLYSLLIFANNWNGVIRMPDQEGMTGKIFSLSIDNGDGVSMSLIPVRVGSGANAVGYMYDRVSGELFGNAGTGAFVIGPDASAAMGGGISANA